MKSLIRTVTVLLALAAAPAAGAAASLWLHVRVTEEGSRPSTVKINVPYTLVERAAPLVAQEHVDDGELVWNGDEVEIDELRGTWRALRATRQTVVRDGASWELVGDGATETLVVRESGASPGAEVRIPARLVDALLSDGDRLDFAGAVRVIAGLGAGELLAVDEDGTRVRIWVDSTPEAE